MGIALPGVALRTLEIVWECFPAGTGSYPLLRKAFGFVIYPPTVETHVLIKDEGGSGVLHIYYYADEPPILA